MIAYLLLLLFAAFPFLAAVLLLFVFPSHGRRNRW